MANLDFLSKSITVSTMDQFKNALHEEYGVINIQGEAKDVILNKFHNLNTGNKVSKWTTALGLFLWPLLFVGAGGWIYTRQANKYIVNENKGNITLVHKASKV